MVFIHFFFFFFIKQERLRKVLCLINCNHEQKLVFSSEDTLLEPLALTLWHGMIQVSILLNNPLATYKSCIIQ